MNKIRFLNAPKGFLGWCLLLLLTSHANAQLRQWTNYSCRPTVWATVADRQGNLWCATYNGGAARYDGSVWTTYNMANSGIASNLITCVTIDSLGNKWFGTHGAGISKFDGTRWTTYQTHNSRLPSNYIDALVAEGRTIWIGAQDSALSKFDGTNWTVFNTNHAFPIYNVVTIAIDAQRKKWFGTNGSGVIWYDGNTIGWYGSSDLPNPYVRSMAFDSRGHLWITTGYGVATFNGITWRQFNSFNTPGYPTSSINSVGADAQGNVWFGTDRSGFSRYDGATWTHFNQSNTTLATDAIVSVMVDTQNNKWLGTVEHGVIKFDGTRLTNHPIYNGNLDGTLVTRFKKDAQGNKWFSTNSGLTRFDGQSWVNFASNLGGLTNDWIYDFTIDAQGDKWMATHTGAARLQGNTWTHYDLVEPGFSPTSTRSILVDAQGNKWFGTYGRGVYKYNPTMTAFTIYNPRNSGLSGDVVTAIAKDTQGTLWFGTESDGISKFDGVTWTNYGRLNLGFSGMVYDIAVDRQNNKWFATFEGVLKFDGVNWTLIDPSNAPFRQGLVKSIAIDEANHKWLGMEQRGIIQLDSAGSTVLNYNMLNSPLATNQINNVLHDGQDIWFVGFAGVTKASYCALQVDSVAIQHSTCNQSNGRLSVAAHGTGNLQYALDTIHFQRSAVFEGLASGTYQVMVKDEQQCVLKKNALVIRAIRPVITNVSVTNSVCTQENGKITILATGGAGTLSYALDTTNFQLGNIFSGLLAGSYTVFVRDTAGCRVSDTAQLMDSGVVPQANFTFARLDNRTIQFTNTTTNTLRPSYKWQFGDGQTSSLTHPTVTYNQSGDYVVRLTVKNDSLCSHAISKTLLHVRTDETQTILTTAYPNPVETHLILVCSQGFEAGLFNASGQLLRNIHLQTGPNTIFMNDLSSGIYWLRGDNGIVVKVVKQ
jgi:ligand-binding sensor domain-containing protein